MINLMKSCGEVVMSSDINFFGAEVKNTEQVCTLLGMIMEVEKLLFVVISTFIMIPWSVITFSVTNTSEAHDRD